MKRPELGPGGMRLSFDELDDAALTAFVLRREGEIAALQETHDLSMMATANLPARREELARAKVELVRRIGGKS